MEIYVFDVGRGGRGYPKGQGGPLTTPLLAVLDQPIDSGGRRVKLAAWLLLIETVLAAITLILDSIEAGGSVNAPVSDLSDPSSSLFAGIVGPLFFFPVLILLVLVAMVVGAWPRGGRWFTIPAQLSAVLVLLISLRGPLEAIAAVVMAMVAIYAELLLFKRPRRAAGG